MKYYEYKYYYYYHSYYYYVNKNHVIRVIYDVRQNCRTEPPKVSHLE